MSENGNLNSKTFSFQNLQVASYCDVRIGEKIYSVLVVWLKRYKVVKAKDLCVSHFCSLYENLKWKKVTS